MPRDMTHRESHKRASAKRVAALERLEFKTPSVPRVSASSAMSAPLKAEDPHLRRLIDEALARRARA